MNSFYGLVQGTKNSEMQPKNPRGFAVIYSIAIN
jgi:hypothetical protein